MRGVSLKRFKVYTPASGGPNQTGGGIFRWSAPPPFYRPGVPGDIPPQLGGVKKGFKSGLKKRSLSEKGRGAKRGASSALKNEVKRKIRRKLNDIFGA
ncbi:hypothetical protein pdam_00025662 [Pocillopora damicornis]|uniref:Uncharacterized protein n=1 Tax=Pocillopora damicornis TaxID=46731 RepID=A0A3M6TQK4_POCDA|nr:hypothetical protein pdam_00025662 [Pocillopora damicornis]